MSRSYVRVRDLVDSCHTKTLLCAGEFPKIDFKIAGVFAAALGGVRDRPRKQRNNSKKANLCTRGTADACNNPGTGSRVYGT